MTRPEIHDQVAPELRAWWRAAGYCPDADLFALFDRRAAEHPERPAVIDDETTVDYATLRRRSLALAAGLSRAGLRPGEVLFAQLPSGWRAVAVELAAAALGAVVLPFPVGRDRHDTAAVLGASAAAAVVCPSSAAAGLRDLTNRRGESRTAAAGSAGTGTAEAGTAEVHATEKPTTETGGAETGTAGVRTIVTSGPAVPGCLDLDTLLHGKPPADRPAAAPDPWAPARIVVSSGSESTPKLVAYSHEALAGGRAGPLAHLLGGRPQGAPGPLRGFFLIPLATSFGTLAAPVTLARHGGTVITTARFDADRVARMVARHRPTHLFGVPTMFQLLLDSAELAGADTSELRAVVSGGARLDSRTRERCRTRFGCPVVNCYGAADGVNCMTRLDDPAGLAHTCVGRPDPDIIAIRVVDGTTGRDAPAGAMGEVWGLGPMSPLGYVGAPDRDRRYRVDGGWVRTGDLGLFDADGRLHIAGRRDEVVIRGGRNLSPVEIELLLTGHPGVRQAVCVGVDDPLMGERLCACVVPATAVAPPTLDELNTWLVGEHAVEKGKLPERLAVVADLPFSAAGKVDRRALRRQVAGAPDRPAPPAPSTAPGPDTT
ncbi:class I adenylate-forming enzyme family protein [Streptomyces sp. MST-110588]|uniref:class I adenylate-forming enzyme family protein n=1 Tax=Streptomyces sp. MST-110588 TaxID=2833628 RepID=UPI001F5C6A85|nr:class I adenylate-forming enzyme family protein [Streptomyces sp. MST-110588]UNO38510.1 acyl--CoA ligase [Streptomyces sp. MST-110588]